MNKLLLLLIFSPLLINAQSKKERKAMAEAREKADQLLLSNLKAHVQYLATNNIEDNKEATSGETIARNYIIKAFEQIGLQPKGSNGYAQEFLIDEGRIIDTTTYLTINDHHLQLKSEYFPLAYCPNKKATGSAAIDLKEAGGPWFIDVKDWLETNKTNSQFNIHEVVQNEARRVALKGATTLIIYNSGKIADNINFDLNSDLPPVNIPVIYLTPEAFTKYCSDRSAFLDIDLNVNIKDRKHYTSNIAGYIDNNAPSTIIIGANYNYVGLSNTNTGQNILNIANGVADNTSGTAALIELARLLKTTGSTKNNYLFIAFTAKNKSLAGSKYWLQNPTINTPVNYMINMDMIGSYDNNQKLTIGGTGTSPAFTSLITGIKNHELLLKLNTAVISHSDHVAFYEKEIPVLYFNTGMNTAELTTFDNSDKINYEGEVKIVHFINNLVQNSSSNAKVAFTKPAEPPLPQAVRTTVSLGVIPDKDFAGAGLRIHGVSPKKLADKIGLQPGDILIQLGDHQIKELNTYLYALSKFKKGDTTHLKIVRGSEEKQLSLNF